MLLLSLLVPIAMLIPIVVQPNNGTAVALRPVLSGYFSYANSTETCATQLHLTYQWLGASPKYDSWQIGFGAFSPFAVVVDSGKGPVNKSTVKTVNVGYGSTITAWFPEFPPMSTPGPGLEKKIQVDRPCRPTRVSPH
jgi:hypothetical protein